MDVPYTATPPSIFAVVSGQIQMFFGNVSDIVASVRAGEVRLLAVSTAKRMPQFPDVPTASESVPGFIMSGHRQAVESRAGDLPRPGDGAKDGQSQSAGSRQHA